MTIKDLLSVWGYEDGGEVKDNGFFNQSALLDIFKIMEPSLNQSLSSFKLPSTPATTEDIRKRLETGDNPYGLIGQVTDLPENVGGQYAQASNPLMAPDTIKLSQSLIDYYDTPHNIDFNSERHYEKNRHSQPREMSNTPSSLSTLFHEFMHVSPVDKDAGNQVTHDVAATGYGTTQEDFEGLELDFINSLYEKFLPNPEDENLKEPLKGFKSRWQFNPEILRLMGEIIPKYKVE